MTFYYAHIIHLFLTTKIVITIAPHSESPGLNIKKLVKSNYF